MWDSDAYCNSEALHCSEVGGKPIHEFGYDPGFKLHIYKGIMYRDYAGSL